MKLQSLNRINSDKYDDTQRFEEEKNYIFFTKLKPFLGLAQLSQIFGPSVAVQAVSAAGLRSDL